MTEHETPKPQEGTWTLTAPDGRTWQAESPIRACGLESRERVPPDVALARILSAAAEESETEALRAQLAAVTEERDLLNLRIKARVVFSETCDGVLRGEPMRLVPECVALKEQIAALTEERDALQVDVEEARDAEIEALTVERDRLRAALTEMVRLDDMHFPSAAPYEWMGGWDAVRAALQPVKKPTPYAREGLIEALTAALNETEPGPIILRRFGLRKVVSCEQVVSYELIRKQKESTP